MLRVSSKLTSQYSRIRGKMLVHSAVNINVIFDIQTRAGDSSPFFSPHYKDSLKALKRSKQIIYNKQKTYLSPNKSLNFCSTVFLFPFFLSVFFGGEEGELDGEEEEEETLGSRLRREETWGE